jgi:hypothetical protein
VSTFDHASTERSSARPARTSPGPAGTRLDAISARFVALQRQAGNAAVAGFLGTTSPIDVQRDATAAGAPPAQTPGTAGSAQHVSTDGSAPADASAVAAQVTLYPIYDRQKKKVFVDAAAYEVERQKLARVLRYFAREIPDDMRKVLDDYPYSEIAEKYKDVIDSLNRAGEAYAKGDLNIAGYWAHDCRRYSGFEMDGWKLFKQESVLSYVGKRIGADIIGFIEGAAEAMVGLIDQGASLIGFHPGLEERIHQRYDTIFEGYQ